MAWPCISNKNCQESVTDHPVIQEQPAPKCHVKPQEIAGLIRGLWWLITLRRGIGGWGPLDSHDDAQVGVDG